MATAIASQPMASQTNDLVRRYQEVERRVSQLKHQGAAKSAEVTVLLDELNELQVLIKRPKEELIDTQLFSLTTEAAVQLGRRLATGGKTFTAGDLVRRLKSRYVHHVDAQRVGAADPSAFQWAELGAKVAGWFRPAPACHHMLGPMDAAPKPKRPVAQRRKREMIAPVERPDVVAGAGAAAEETPETDRNMERMWNILKQQPNSSAPLLELVLNHASFSQTVENLFTLSFLVRDARVEFVEDATTGVIVKMRQGQARPKDKEARAAEGERVQFVVTLNFEEWEKWKSIVKPGMTLMPHRHPVHNLGGDEDQGPTKRRQMEQGKGGRQTLRK